jgi:hypothetical protein
LVGVVLQLLFSFQQKEKNLLDDILGKLVVLQPVAGNAEEVGGAVLIEFVNPGIYTGLLSCESKGPLSLYPARRPVSFLFFIFWKESNEP